MDLLISTKSTSTLPVLNLINVMKSKPMASQAFLAYYFVKGCLSNCYKLISKKSRKNSVQAILTTQLLYLKLIKVP